MDMTSLKVLPRGFATIAIAVAVTAGLGQSAHAQRRRSSGYSSRIDTTFAFDKNGTVNVTSWNGDIVVTGWSRDQVHVRATSDDDNLQLETSGTSRLTLGVGGSRRGGEARFEVSVPYGVRVVAHAQSGDVSVRGTRGEVEVRSQSGDVRLEDVAGRLDVNSFSGDLTASNVNADVQINSVSGSVKMTDVRGTVDVGSVSGDIDLRGVTSKLVRGKTTSGDVVFDGLIDPAGRYDLNTHSGDIRLHVPRDASAQLTVSTWNGGIDSDFPITLRPGEHGIGSAVSKRFTFEIGGGAARINAETFSGDITISSNGRGASDRR
jgi:DUF4097 and DUF4098 domain-containing protein YvlB